MPSFRNTHDKFCGESERFVSHIVMRFQGWSAQPDGPQVHMRLRTSVLIIMGL
jgi:hypothetical protein